VGGKAGEHASLIVHAQMEEAVPRQDSIEATTEIKASHVAHQPFGMWKSRSTQRDERGRRVHTDHLVSLVEQITPDWLPHPATQIQDCADRADALQEEVKPAFFLETSAPIAIVIPGSPLIEIDDALVWPTVWKPRTFVRSSHDVRMSRLNVSGYPDVFVLHDRAILHNS
jgi:hypothetical protein